MDPREDSLKEACGVVGVYAPGEDVARIAYHALLALQHRGEESAGIAVSDGRLITVSKYMGLVSQVFDETTLSALEGHLATGHVRYSTTGSSRWENSQPIYREGELAVALGHNGNLVNTMELAERLDQNHSKRGAATTDSDLIAQMIATSRAGDVEAAILEVLPQLRGAFTLTMMDESTVFGCRDPHGFRPLVLGKISGGFVLASETCALTAIGAELVREVEPGEMVAIDSEGIRSHRFAEATPAQCIFEYVYFARADSLLYGRSVQKARFNAGVRLAQEAPADADLTMPVPDTGRGAAAGYSKGSGIPFGEGLVRNQYVGRTFIQPTQQMRRQGIRTKLNPMPEMIRDKRLVVVEDSIVRGNTTRQIVHMLRDAGAKEVHMRIASPPIRWPCFYGIDMPTRAELVASEMSVDEIRDYIQADSLAYLSLEGLIASAEGPGEEFCTACFSSEYPIPIPETVKVGKHLLEDEVVVAESFSGD